MSITTRSVFYYGHNVTSTNYTIDFNDGSVRQAQLDIGAYTLTDFAVEVARAMTEVGGQTYSCAVDRATRKLTISATSNFSILTTSGDSLGTSAFTLMGFSGADKTGTNTYQGSAGSGSEFLPQFLLQDYISADDWKENINAAVNQAASGVVEVITFGSVYFMQCNVTLQTDIDQGTGNAIETDASGVDNLRTFLEYCTTKSPIEFMEDRSSRNTFIECLLESTPEDQKGTGFKLKELYGRNLPNYYETGTLKFRRL